MSTFKRLLNLGKGKVKVATRTRDRAPATPSTSGDEVLADARHAVADAAEALADAIRPPEGDAPDEAGEPVGRDLDARAPDDDPPPAAAGEPGTRSDLAGSRPDADPAGPEDEAPKKPAKRTL